jgi:hypothetical protein
LFEGQSFDEIKNVRDLFEELNAFLLEKYPDDELVFSLANLLHFDNLIKDSRKTLTAKKNESAEIFGIAKKQQKEIVSAFLGGKVALSKLFDNEDCERLEENKICFKDKNFDEKVPIFQADLGEVLD